MIFAPPAFFTDGARAAFTGTFRGAGRDAASGFLAFAGLLGDFVADEFIDFSLAIRQLAEVRHGCPLCQVECVCSSRFGLDRPNERRFRPDTPSVDARPNVNGSIRDARIQVKSIFFLGQTNGDLLN